MPSFAIIDIEGRITRTGFCGSDDIQDQATGTDVAIETTEPMDDTLHYFTATGFEAYPARPGPWAAFDFHAQEWTDPRSLDDIHDEAEAAVRRFRDAVNAHRLTIIAAGSEVEITGHGPVALQGRQEDLTSLQGLAFGAQLRLSMGDSTTLMPFLDRLNVMHHLLPAQMLQLWQKGAAFVSAVYARSWVIKDMDPETDITDPQLWAL
jgi:hypothetical protein